MYLVYASIACYIAAQYDPGLLEQSLRVFLPVKLAWFHLGAIQILFSTGLILGFLYVKGCLPNIHKLFAAMMVLLLGITGFLYMTGIEASSLGPLRLGCFVFKAYAVFLGCHWVAFKPLALLGRHSLTVFSYHIGLIYFLVFFLTELLTFSATMQYAALVLFLATIWIPAKIQEAVNQRVKIA